MKFLATEKKIDDLIESYHDFVERFAFNVGERGYLTINESFVESGSSQRGYGNSNRTLHTEACKGNQWTTWNMPVKAMWGGSTWGRSAVYLDDDLKVLIGNSIGGTCAIWDAEENPTEDGDLGGVAHKYPRSEAIYLRSGDIAEIGIRTPHECIPQLHSATRQFVRIVGNGVHGRAPHFTVNPVLGA